MALVQVPLAAVLAQPEIERPRDLEGERAGVTGLPSDVAVLRSVVAGDGGDPEQVRTTTIGFEAVKALLAGRVAGATAFWKVEGVALRAKRPGTREFRVDQFGAPSYPELVLCVTRDALEEKRPVILATIRALQRGYTQAQTDPESAVTALLDADSGLDRDTAQAQVDAVSPAWTAGARATASCARTCWASGRSGTSSSASSTSSPTWIAPSTPRWSGRSQTPEPQLDPFERFTFFPARRPASHRPASSSALKARDGAGAGVDHPGGAVADRDRGREAAHVQDA
jgi:hypothetical protein